VSTTNCLARNTSTNQCSSVASNLLRPHSIEPISKPPKAVLGTPDARSAVHHSTETTARTTATAAAVTVISTTALTPDQTPLPPSFNQARARRHMVVGTTKAVRLLRRLGNGVLPMVRGIIKALLRFPVMGTPIRRDMVLLPPCRRRGKAIRRLGGTRGMRRRRRTGAITAGDRGG